MIFEAHFFISFVVRQTADSIATRDVLQRYPGTVWGRWTLMEVNSVAVFLVTGFSASNMLSMCEGKSHILLQISANFAFFLHT